MIDFVVILLTIAGAYVCGYAMGCWRQDDRDAGDAATSGPDGFLYHVGRVKLHGDDVLVVRVAEGVRPSAQQLDQMRQSLETVLPGVRYLVLANGEELSLLSRDEIDRRSQNTEVAS